MLKFDILSLIYPFYCWQCKKIIKQGGLCQDCSKMTLVPPARISITEEKYLTVMALTDYVDPIRSMVLRKFSSDVVAYKHLSKIILDKLNLGCMDIDCIVPIPLHFLRYVRRGFNQAELMANTFGKKLNIPVVNALKRVKWTSYQSKLSGVEKEENLKGAFVLMQDDLIQDKNILIVDDLCTTGITLKNAARTLVNGSPKSMLALVACRKV